MRRIRAAALGLALALGLGGPAVAQAPGAPPAGALTGTLGKVAQGGRITLGYREGSLPFSWLDASRQPVGYSVDLCLAVVEEVREQLGRAVAVEWRPVTPQTRIPELLAGRIDLECGSTTSNAERERQVAFSPVFFVAGTRLLVPRESRVRSLADLAGRTVLVTAGTTNADAIEALIRRQRLAITLRSVPEHEQGFARLAAGEADAFATDDVLLYGLIAKEPGGERFRVTGPLLSYEPYGLMFRRDDPAFADLVNRTFRRLAASGELRGLYDRWFTRRLPGGERLDVPIGPQLAEFFRMLGAPD
ncbi:amino acid ABC transporter substrate-binding protein [Falsiroseomonas sp. HW251]|uniref:amino acid ABC transporter substrate-binding protein n=1 Tax=Falsiroseomonas sp. HW251 TaxID=3390998 RepID=UPI003D31C8A1